MIRKITLAAILFLLSAPANGQPAPRCSLSTTGVSFGEIQFATRTNLTATGAIVISCVGNGSVDYVLSLGPGVNSQFTPRLMPLLGGTGADNLPYNLYSETALSSIWGNGFGVTTVVNGRLRLGPIGILPLPIYGRVETPRGPMAGEYVDTVIATLVVTGAANISIPVPITAHVSNSCTISATNLNFVDYNQLQDDGQSQIQLTCTDATPWNVGLDGGRFPGALTSRRSMAGPGPSQLDYQLFTNPARTNVWGNNVGSDTVSGTGNGLPQTLDVYGRIPAGQSVRDGGYADTITATITF
jgi:spore coat protein U-like protein